MKSSLPFLLSLFIYVPSLSQDAKSILFKSIEECQSIKEGYYEIERIDTFYRNEKAITRNILDKTYFSKNTNDTLFECFFYTKEWYDSVKFKECTNNGKEFGIYYDKKDTGAKIDRTKYSWEDITDYQFEFLFNAFTHEYPYPLPTKRDLKSKRISYELLGLDTFQGDTCFLIKIDTKPFKNSPVKSNSSWIWIHRETFLPVKSKRKLIVQNKGITPEIDINYNLVKYTDFKTKIDSTIFQFKNKDWFSKLEEFKIKESTLIKPNTIAPTWTYTDLNGDSISLDSLKGKVVLLDFFFVGCSPCREIAPKLQAIYDTYKDKGFDLISINPTREKLETTKAYIDKNKYTYTVLTADKSINAMYGIEYYPTLVLIDKNGIVIALPEILFDEKGEKELIKAIKKALKK